MIVKDAHTLEDAILKTQKQLADIRKPREDVWQNISDLILPVLEDILLKKKPRGGRTGAERYSGAGMVALKDWADGMFGYLVSPSIAWFRIEHADYRLMDLPEVRQWCQQLTEHFRWRLKQGSNFYDALSTAFEHGGGLGFANVFTEYDQINNFIVCHNFHPGELYFNENNHGVVDTIFRKFGLKAGEAVRKFANFNGVTEPLERAAKLNPYEEWDFIHAIYPRENYNPKKIDALNMPIASVWVQVDGKKITKEWGYNINPYHIWRVSKGSTAYGRGPGEDALIEISQDNTMHRTLLLAAEKSVMPPIQAPAKLEGKVDLRPDGITWIDDKTEIKNIYNRIDYPVGVDMMDRVKAVIEKHFRLAYFQLLAALETRQPLTATQVQAMKGEQAASLSRPVDRLTRELLDPMFDRFYQIDYENGNLPPVPDILLEQGGDLSINYLGPLAQEQKRLFDIKAYLLSFENMAMATELLGPEVLDNIDKDYVARDILKVNAFPEEAIRAPEDVALLRQARMEAQKQETELENLERMAKVSKDAGMADKMTKGKLLGANVG